MRAPESLTEAIQFLDILDRQLECLSECVHDVDAECQRLNAVHKRYRQRFMKPVFIKTYHATNWIGMLIAKFTNAEYHISHVQPIIPVHTVDDGWVMYELQIDPDNGVVFRPHDPDWRDGIYQITYVTTEERRFMEQACREIDGKKYDKPGLRGFVTRRRSEDPGKWFCSEGTSFVFRRGRRSLSHKPDCLLSPYDCYASVRMHFTSDEEMEQFYSMCI